jgi:hypothetical protein
MPHSFLMRLLCMVLGGRFHIYGESFKSLTVRFIYCSYITNRRDGQILDVLFAWLLHWKHAVPARMKLTRYTLLQSSFQFHHVWHVFAFQCLTISFVARTKMFTHVETKIVGLELAKNITSVSRTSEHQVLGPSIWVATGKLITSVNLAGRNIYCHDSHWLIQLATWSWIQIASFRCTSLFCNCTLTASPQHTLQFQQQH